MKYTINNYEEHAIDFLDGAMSNEEVEEFRAFLELHPKIKSELHDIEVVSLPKYQVTFPLKKKLFQEEKLAKKRTLFFHLRNIAAAIILLLMITFFWTNQITKDNVVVSEMQLEKNVGSLITDSTTEVKMATKKQSDLVASSSNVIANKLADKKIVKTKIVQKGHQAPIDLKAEVIEEPIFAVDVTEKEDVTRLLLKDAENLEKPSRPEVRELSVIEPIQTTTIRPTFSGQIIPALPEEMILISSEVVEKEGPTKIGKLLAKISLIPEGILEEFSANNLRESLLPEYYSDLK